MLLQMAKGSFPPGKTNLHWKTPLFFFVSLNLQKISGARFYSFSSSFANKNKNAIFLGEKNNISYSRVKLKSLIYQCSISCTKFESKGGALKFSLVIHGFQLRIGFNFVTASWKMQKTEGDNCQTIPSLYIHKTIISVNSLPHFFKGCSRSLICLWTSVRGWEYQFLWHLEAKDQTIQMPLNSKWCAQTKQTLCDHISSKTLIPAPCRWHSLFCHDQKPSAHAIKPP